MEKYCLIEKNGRAPMWVDYPTTDIEMVKKGETVNRYDYDIKIMKHEVLFDGGTVLPSYMKITGRIYNKDYSRYRTFRTVLPFYLDDLQLQFERNHKITDEEIHENVDSLFDDMIACWIDSYNDCKKFYQRCDREIKSYNIKVLRNFYIRCDKAINYNILLNRIR